MQVLTVAAIPLLLILKQPDYGTGSAFVFALLCMHCYSRNFKKIYNNRYFISYYHNTIIIFLCLTTTCKTKIQVFLNPAVDPRDQDTTTQSKIAIGAGQLTGMGYLKGNQTQLGFLYPKSTDFFIFSVIGEKLGFVVAGSIIILYVVLITKSISIPKPQGMN